MIWGISQHSLHDCTLFLDNMRLPRAGLFPFFDDEGRTQALMLVEAANPRILLPRFTNGIFNRRPPWRKNLPLRLSDLRDGSAEDAAGLAGLWHFDPWWELAEDRFAGHPAVPPLKGTNIPGYDPELTRLWFSADLSAVTWVGFGKGEEFKMKRFHPKHLAQARRKRGDFALLSSPAEPRTGWVLRPWW